MLLPSQTLRAYGISKLHLSAFGNKCIATSSCLLLVVM